jgi:hypothetical protein
MPTITATRTDFVDGSVARWTPLANGDDGSPATFIGSGDRTIQITGTFGVGGTVIVEGSLDGTNWFQLRDPTHTAISLTAAGLRAVLENVPFFRPRVTAGDGTTAITALLHVRRNNNA